MPVNNGMQEFRIHTLVDITDSKQTRREPGREVEYKQHQNYMTLLQTASMRVNLLDIKVSVNDTTEYTFGSLYKGKQRVWTFRFFIEYDGGFVDSTGNPAGLLLSDLNFIPIITDLTESASIDPPMLNTQDVENFNTIIEVIDDK